MADAWWAGRNMKGIFQDTVPLFSWRDWWIPRKALVRSVGAPCETRTEHPSLGHYCCTNLLGCSFFRLFFFVSSSLRLHLILSIIFFLSLHLSLLLLRLFALFFPFLISILFFHLKFPLYLSPYIFSSFHFSLLPPFSSLLFLFPPLYSLSIFLIAHVPPSFP
jgi:hypothetical protein